MAAKALETNKERQNFQRLTRLLIAGATTIGRETFDAIHPPATLATVLADPVREAILRWSKMTRPQWTQVYPSTGKYGKSKDWDLTLIHKMIRSIGGLTPPATGWDDLPPEADVSKEADLVRLKYYRNSIYGHVDERMEINDEDFEKLWKDISEAIIHLAGYLSLDMKKEWEGAIDELLTAPLTSDDLRNVDELKRWYQQDVATREDILEIKGDIKVIEHNVEQLIRTVERQNSSVKARDPTVDTCSEPYHEGQLVEWFCEACRECVCRTCVTLDHRTHPCVNMNDPDHVQKVAQELLETSERVRRGIDKYQKLIRKIRSCNALRNEKLNKLKNDVKSVVNNFIEQLHEQEEKLIRDIETTQRIYQDIDDSQVNEITEHVKDMETAVIYTENLANDGSALNTITKKEQTLKCNSDLIAVDLKQEPLTMTGCRFTPNGNLPKGIKDFGTVCLWDCVAEGDGLKKAIVGLPSTFAIKSVAIHGSPKGIIYTSATLNVTIYSPQGSVTPAIHDENDGTYTVTYVPTHVGDHAISAVVEGQELSGCPHIVNVKECVLTGEALTKGIVGLEGQFMASLCDPGNEGVYDPSIMLDVKICSPQGNITTTIQDNEDGTYIVSFVPTHPGDHNVSVMVDGQELPDCQHIVKVKQFALTEEGLARGVVGLRSKLVATLFGPENEKVYDPTVTLDVKLLSPQGNLTAAVHDNKDGTYIVTFLPTHPGEHQISITFDGQEIPGCPYIVEIKQCVLTGEGLTKGIVGLRSQFEATFCGADGEKADDLSFSLELEIQSPQGTVTAAIRDNKDGSYLVSYFPVCPGDHQISVTVQSKLSNYGHQKRAKKKFTVAVGKRDLRAVLEFGKKGNKIGEIYCPLDVAVNHRDEIIVADSGNHRVQIFNCQGEHLGTIGKRGTGAGQFDEPNGVVSDKHRDIIVLDKGNNRIQKFNESGEFIRSFGSKGRGSGQLINPWGLSLDDDNNVIVTDRGNKRVQLFNDEGKWLKSFDCGEEPSHCVAHGERYYVSHSVHCIKVFDHDGTFLCKYGARGSSPGTFEYPIGLAVDKAAQLVVCDFRNHRVQVLQIDGTFVASFGNEGGELGQFWFPHTVAVMGTGKLVVCDSWNSRIQILE